MNLDNTIDTSIIMDNILPHIDDFPYMFDHNNKTVKNIIKKMYNEINTIYNNNLKVLKYTRHIKNKKENNFKDLLNSNFTPKKIKKEMDIIDKIIEYNTIIHKIPIKIIFLIQPQETISNYDLCFKEICHWLTFIIPYSNSKMKSFKIILHLSDIKKKIPNKQTDILDTNNCNTAVTYACAIHGSCLIYRKEEWFKVMIHETMHAFCLDFSGLDYIELRKDLKKIFPLKIDFEISETYSEFWATILNCLFKTYEQKITDNDIIGFDSFYNVFSSMVYLEISFSLFQTIKILDFMNINYNDLFNNNVIYKQKTNVFEYYILKSIFLFNYVDFLKLCDNNNTNCINFYKSNTMLNNIFDFVSDKYNDKDFMEALNIMEKIYNQIQNEFMKNTMRMTVF